MITMSKVSGTTIVLARTFNTQIVEDLIIKIKSHCCMLGIATPCVKVFDEEGFKFVNLDDFVLSLDDDNLSMAEIEHLRMAEKYYLNKIVTRKAHVYVSYEVYLEEETQKYIRRHTEEFLNKK